MTTADLPLPACALAIGAHPDDIEFGGGGALSHWSERGAEVHLMVLTDGSKGTWDATADPKALAEHRAHEQQLAADRLGVAEVHFGGAIDGELEADELVQARVCEVVRRIRPIVVLGHDPWRRHRIHPDHTEAGRALVAGLVAARDPHFFPGLGGDPARPGVVLLFESDTVNHVESYPRRALVAKTEALLAHRSQWRSTMRIHADPAVERPRFERRVETASRAAGARLGRAFGDAFRRVDGW